MQKNMNIVAQCANCGRQGHSKQKCFEPYISYGVILFHTTETLQLAAIDKKINISASNKINYGIMHQLADYINSIHFLIVRRKHSYSFIEFIGGKYELDDVEGLTTIFQYLTRSELQLIRERDYQANYEHLGMLQHFSASQYEANKAKFNKVRASALFKKLCLLVQYEEPEWGFPKGRKSSGENNLECAMREFCEETHLQHSNISIYQRVLPLSESYVGTDGHNYKHIYYIGQLDSKKPLQALTIDITTSNEITQIKWITLGEMGTYFRDYQIEKKKLLCELTLFILYNLRVRKTI